MLLGCARPIPRVLVRIRILLRPLGAGDCVLRGLNCHVVLNKEVLRHGVIECICYGGVIDTRKNGKTIEYNLKQ
jgi:hypothetical protein